ncbi:MAG: RHS repeat-associated core domain-containing protein [Myxococcota bacterium]
MRTAYQRIRDFTLSTPKGPFYLDRILHFVNAEGPFTANGPPPPYGHVPFDTQGAIWTNNWHSFIQYQDSGTNALYVELFDENRVSWKFDYTTRCTSCWLNVAGANSFSAPGRLQRFATGFRYVRPGRNEYRYSAEHIDRLDPTKRRFYLSEIRTTDGQTLAQFEYGLPTLTPACRSFAQNGSMEPYLLSVALAGGAVLSLEYSHRQEGSEDVCVVNRILHRPAPGAPSTTIAQYSGSLTGGLYPDHVAGPQLEQFYTLDPLGNGEVSLSVSTASGTIVSRNTVLGWRVLSQTPDHGAALNYSVVAPTLSAALGRYSSCDSNYSTAIRIDGANLQHGGSDLSLTAAATSEIKTNWDNGGWHRPVTLARVDDCASNSQSCSPGTVEMFRIDQLGDSQCVYRTGVGLKSKEGGWYSQPTGFLPSSPDVSPPYLAATAAVHGAEKVETTSGPVLTNGLTSTVYSYLISSDGQQRVSSESTPSGLTTGSRTRTFVYDENGQSLLGIVEAGATRNVSGHTRSRRVGTFFKQQRACSPSGADPYKRILRVEGPCEVTTTPVACTTSATCGGEVCQRDASGQGSFCQPISCSGTDFPVTEYVYYGAAGGGVTAAQANRLRAVLRYPDGALCGTAPIETRFLDYTTDGYPTVVEEDQGTATAVRREYDYLGGFLNASRILQGTETTETRYTWEDGLLTDVQLPRGNHEVFCYRDGPIDDSSPARCQGNMTRKLQWRAKADSQMLIYEGVRYEYFAEGSLKGERTFVLDQNGRVEYRQTKLRNVDVHGRQTYWQIGLDSSVSGARRYDGNNNVIARSNGAQVVPDFCGGPAAASGLCSWLKYDRADRLAETLAEDTGSNRSKTCIDYDRAGDISRVSRGCPLTAVCAANQPGVKSSCGEAIDYRWDDFGNVVEVSSGTGWQRFEYGVGGELLRKRTSEDIDDSRIEYVYDSLGRETSVTAYGPTGTPTLLRATDYDGSSPCHTLENTRGRPSHRSDSFGDTWYSYDAQGNMRAEYRRRASVVGCPTARHDAPHTLYSYTSNGELASIEYPSGRTITYEFGVDSPVYGRLTDVDRVWQVRTSRHFSSGTTEEVIVRDVTWEPFGGLRSYTAGDTRNWTVEYHLSAATSTAPTTIPSDPCAGTTIGDVVSTPIDETGHKRAFWVSLRELSKNRGAGDGALLKQVYTWDGTNISRIDSCLRNGTWSSRDLTYDKQSRLVRTELFNETDSEKVYKYNQASQRKSLDTSRYHIEHNNLEWAAHNRQTLGSISKAGFSIDSLGRAIVMERTGQGLIELSYPGAAELGTVYRTVTVHNGGLQLAWEYFYDWRGQRRLKLHPNGASEEYFYLHHGQLLTEFYSHRQNATTSYGTDDYIYLDGSMIAFARSDFASGALADDPGSAHRLDEEIFKSVYHVATDAVGRPTVVLESTTGAVSGYAVWDDFGSINRTLISATGQVGEEKFAVPSGLPMVDARISIGDSKGDVYLDNEQVANGYRQNEWSPWIPVTGGMTELSFQGTGFVGQYFEYRVYEDPSIIAFPPHRLAGQRYDPETDLHENWNRYFDAVSGNYLSPEPMLQVPFYVNGVASAGHSVPTYAYAVNNPLRYSDSNGLFVSHDKVSKCPNWDKALKLAQEKAGCTGQSVTKACSAALNCNICPFLVEGAGPDAFFKDLGYTSGGRWRAGHTTLAMGLPPTVVSVEFDTFLCQFEGDVFVKALAAVIIHEASEHACSEPLGKWLKGHSKTLPEDACMPGCAP